MKAIIYSRTYLPGLGQGPFLQPIEIDTELIKILIRSRASYKIVNEEVIPEQEEKEDIAASIEEAKADEEVTLPVIETKNNSEEDIIEKEIDYSEMTVEQLKSLCKENNIEFKYKDTKAVLIDKLINR